jgi:hypothetical protein
VRTTLTLDSDVMDRIKAAMRERGVSFKDAVNETLRVGFDVQKQKRSQTVFSVQPSDMGPLPSGQTYDCIGKLLEDADGRNYK